MGVRILNCTDYDSPCTRAVLYSSNSDWAFGPVFYDEENHDAVDRAQLFLDWLRPLDAYGFTDDELERKYQEWRAQEKEQWAAKEMVVEEND